MRVWKDLVKNFLPCGLLGFGSQVHDTMEGVLGLLPVLLSPAGRRKNPSDSQVKIRIIYSVRG